MNKVLDEDPLSTKAAELRARSEEVSRQLDEFQAVSDGRFDNVLSAVRAEVAAVREAAVEAGSEALDTARPQVKDSLDEPLGGMGLGAGPGRRPVRRRQLSDERTTRTETRATEAGRTR